MGGVGSVGAPSPAGVVVPVLEVVELLNTMTASMMNWDIADPIGSAGIPPAPGKEEATLRAASTAFCDGERYSVPDDESTLVVESAITEADGSCMLIGVLTRGACGAIDPPVSKDCTTDLADVMEEGG